MALSAASGYLSGSGVEHALGGQSAFSISGEYSDSSQTFTLAILYTNGARATYTGRVYGADSLSGMWTDLRSTPAQSNHEPFDRQIVPPCVNPAPATTGHRGALIVLVQFHDGVNAVVEAEMLADKYGFVVSAVNAAVGQFSAVVSAATATVLRCEPSVSGIGYPF